MVRRQVRNVFAHAARAVARCLSSATIGVLAAAGVAAWTVVGVVGGFSQRWLALLYAVTGASTFVMVFFIQHSTNRESRAMLLKLDELVRATTDAQQDVIGVEDRPLHEQERLEHHKRRVLHQPSSPLPSVAVRGGWRIRGGPQA
jgi:low affinity Fe/Cu permease